MRSIAELENFFESPQVTADRQAAAAELLAASEEAIEHWVVARGEEPTNDTREGFRLLALHRQGAKGDPSFNACRETCREVVYHYNLVKMQPEPADSTDPLIMMKMVSKHLFLFISGKMQVAQLGDFCCSAKPIRSTDPATTAQKEV